MKGSMSGHSILPERWNTRASGWIKVSERLPDNYGIFIINSEMHGVTTSIFDGRKFGAPKVTHWQPMPEPPKEES